MNYIYYALLTVVCWGTYGICMHEGSVGMKNGDHGRIMAFLWVGIAYFITAVVAPIVILKLNNVPLSFPTKGWVWSLVAGTLGAIGALGVLLAFGEATIMKSTPPGWFVPVVMSIIFAGAPMVNAIVSTTKEGNWAFVRWPFVLGIAMAALGGYLITKYAPKPPKSPPSANASKA
jgi:hypothetical protein